MGHCYAEALAKGDLGKVNRAFVLAVADSFRSHPMRSEIGRDREMKRRAEICAKWFRTLAEEYRWSIDRALSSVREALRAELDGKKWSPLTHTNFWAPDQVVLGPVD